MKVKHLILSLAALWLGTACSNNEIDGGPDDPATAQAGEIQLIIGGSGESVDYTKTATKGIASESENKIVDMTIYVFANDNPEATPVGSGNYRLQEVWTSAATADKANKKFTLQPSGSEWKASIFPDEWKTRPFLLFYCVANVGTTPPYKEDGITPQPLVPVVLNPDHTGEETGVDDETYVEIFYTAAQAADDNIRTPLVMSGSGQTKIAGSVSKVKIELKRAVARFDIDNTSRSSNFIIESVTMKHARTTAPLVAEGDINPIQKANLETDTKLMTYNEVDFTQFDHANEGITESAIYVNPGLATDEPTLILKGQYISPTTGMPSAASYEVPIQRTNDAGVTDYIAVERNNRYKLRIIDVTSATLKSTFEIEDWVNDGSIDTKPTDTKPTFVTFDPTDVAKQPTDMVDPDKGILPNTTFRLVNDATFTMDVKSSSKVNATLTLYDGQKADWVTLADPIPAPVLTDDGYYTTTLTFTAIDMDKPYFPATVTLYNETSPNDPETQTVLTFFAPEFYPFARNQNPAVAFPETNTLKPNGTAVSIIEMTNQKNSYIAFLIDCPEGADNIEDIAVPDGFSLTKKDYPQHPYTWIYTLRITDPKKAAAAANNEIEIANIANGYLQTIQLDLKEVVSTISSADARAKVAADGLSIELDVAKMNADPTPVAATLHVPAGSSFGSATGPDWLQSAGTGGNPDGSVNIQLSLKPGYTLAGTADDFGDNTFEIENSINGKTDIVTIKAVQNKPVIALSTGTGLGNSLDEVLANGDAQVALNIANGNHADFIITCEDGVKPTNIPEGLKVEDTGTGNLFTITIEDETKVTDAYSLYLTFENALYPLLSQNIEVGFLKVTP